MEEPGRLQSMGSLRVGHDWETSLSVFMDTWIVSSYGLCLVSQLCLTLCDPMDYSLPGSSVHGFLQARTMEQTATPFSRVSSQYRDWTQVSRIVGGFFTVWATREAQEYWSGHPFSSPGDLPNPGMELGSPALQADSLPGRFFTSWATRATRHLFKCWQIKIYLSIYLKIYLPAIKEVSGVCDQTS